MTAPEQRNCLATVVTDAFVPGALVLLHSFLVRNHWFDGDIVVVHDGLTEGNRRRLRSLSDKVRLEEVGVELRARIAALAEARPDLAPKRARFYSLETFRLRGYDKVLFCDSDVLVRRPLGELFAVAHPLVVSGDGPHYEGRSRVWPTRPAAVPAAAAYANVEVAPYWNTFNAGVMLIGAPLLTDEHYAGLMELVDARRYAADASATDASVTDQMILNVHFAGQQMLVGATFNYILAHRTAIARTEHTGLLDAHVLHYNGPWKPWRGDQMLRAAEGDPGMITACGLWWDGYVACLQHLHFAARVPLSR